MKKIADSWNPYEKVKVVL